MTNSEQKIEQKPKVIAESVMAVRCWCPYCKQKQYHEVSDIWSGKEVACPFCGKDFIIVQSEQEAYFDQL